MIRHTVFFRLKHAAGSAAEQDFFAVSDVLATLPTVRNFEMLLQVSRKSNFSHGFSMEFDDQAAYDAYSDHPLHVSYVKDVWLKQVAAFVEIDHVPFAR